jgi:hypothetical protein
MRGGTVAEQDGQLTVTRRYFSSPRFDEDLIRRIAFSLSNLGETVVHNAHLYQSGYITEEQSAISGRLERAAWTQHLSVEDARLFRNWARTKGIQFIEEADAWLGQRELPKHAWSADGGRALGIGVYYFEDRESDLTA